MAGEPRAPMIRVRFRAMPVPTGDEPEARDGFIRQVELPAVPRLGEYVSFDGIDESYKVDAVSWHLDNPLLDVYVILRSDEESAVPSSKEPE
jgi:hypothetical protein